MSTVAWDGKTLAADRQCNNGDLKSPTSKIRRLPDGTLLACTGNLGAGRILMKWYEDGQVQADYPTANQEKDALFARLIVVKDGSVSQYETFYVPIPLIHPFFAWGSGRDFAIGAMANGAKATDAILIASQFDINTGLGVESFDVA